MTLTATQLQDFRADLADQGTSPVFSDAELNRLYARADGDYNRTMVYALRQLLASSAKLHDYAAGQSQESLEQIYVHLKDLLGYWERAAGLTGGEPRTGVLLLGLDESDGDEREEWA